MDGWIDGQAHRLVLSLQDCCFYVQQPMINDSCSHRIAGCQTTVIGHYHYTQQINIHQTIPNQSYCY